MVQPPPLISMTTEATVRHSEPASWMTTEPRLWCYLCYLPSLNLHSQPTKEPGQVIVASLQQNLLGHVAELGHLSSLTGQQIWRVHGITRWWEGSRTQIPGIQGEAHVPVEGNPESMSSSMSPPPAGSRSVSATSGRSDSPLWSNADRLRDAFPTHSQQLPEPPCKRPRCPYDPFPWDEERVASWAPRPTSAASRSLSFAQACERWCDPNHTPRSRNRHFTSPGHAPSPRVRTHLLAVGEHQMCGRLWCPGYCPSPADDPKSRGTHSLTPRVSTFAQ